MRIVVCLKEVPDTQIPLKIKEGEPEIEKESLTFVTNPFDEAAVEKAIRLREEHGGEITFITIGSPRAREILLNALAMGVVDENGESKIIDKAIWVDDSNLESLSPLFRAKILAKVIEKLNCDLILCGRLAIDDGIGQVGPALAEFLNLPQLSAVTKLEVVGERKIRASIRIEDGEKIVECRLPALVTCDRGLVDEPRIPSLYGIMAVGEGNIEKFSLSLVEPEYLKQCTGSNRILKLSLQERGRGRIIEAKTSEEKALELIRLLREEAKVI